MSAYSNKVPFLEKGKYFFWKQRMMIHLQSLDDDYLSYLLDGPEIPKKLVLE